MDCVALIFAIENYTIACIGCLRGAARRDCPKEGIRGGHRNMYKNDGVSHCSHRKSVRRHKVSLESKIRMTKRRFVVSNIENSKNGAEAGYFQFNVREQLCTDPLSPYVSDMNRFCTDERFHA